MNSVVILLTSDSPQRFINPIVGCDNKNIKLPDNCKLIYESDNYPNLSDLLLVNDGFYPVFFDRYKYTKIYKENMDNARMVLATMFVVMGYSQKSQAMSSKESYLLLSLLHEKLELLEYESERHREKLFSFLEREKSRNIFLPLSSDLRNAWLDLQKCKQRVMDAVDDIKKSLGEAERRVLMEISKED